MCSLDWTAHTCMYRIISFKRFLKDIQFELLPLCALSRTQTEHFGSQIPRFMVHLKHSSNAISEYRHHFYIGHSGKLLMSCTIGYLLAIEKDLQ